MKRDEILKSVTVANENEVADKSNLTFHDIKEMYPEMHMLEALKKLAESRSKK